MAERNIKQKDVTGVLMEGEIIRQYKNDKPFPSALFSGRSRSKRLHIVAAFNEKEDIGYIITVYEPSLQYFEPDYKTRKKNENKKK